MARKALHDSLFPQAAPALIPGGRARRVVAALLLPTTFLSLASCGTAQARTAKKPVIHVSKQRRTPAPAPVRRHPDLYINTPFEPGRIFRWPSFPTTVYLNDNSWITGLHWTTNKEGQAVAAGTYFSDLCPQGGSNCPSPQGTETLVASDPETCTVTTGGGSITAYLYNLVDSLSGTPEKEALVQAPACHPGLPTSSTGTSSATGTGSIAWPPLISQAMTYIRARSNTPEEAPSQLPTSSAMANSADASATASSYAVSLYGCPSPLPLNGPGIGNGSCGDLADVYGTFSGQTYPDPAIANSAVGSILTNAAPTCPNAVTSKIPLSPTGPAATLYSVGQEGCKATWALAGWSYVITGAFSSASGSSWEAVASQIASYTAANPLPGSTGVLSADIAPDGVHTSLFWSIGSGVFSATAYHGALPAMQLAEAMLPYPD